MLESQRLYDIITLSIVSTHIAAYKSTTALQVYFGISSLIDKKKNTRLKQKKKSYYY